MESEDYRQKKQPSKLLVAGSSPVSRSKNQQHPDAADEVNNSPCEAVPRSTAHELHISSRAATILAAALIAAGAAGLIWMVSRIEVGL